MIASEWFGVNGTIKDSLKYSYDINGNVKMFMQNGRYSQSTLERSLNKAGLIGRKMPDVIGTARWGKNLLVEVTSKSQTYAQMAAKLTSIVATNPNSTWKVISWASWISKLFM